MHTDARTYAVTFASTVRIDRIAPGCVQARIFRRAGGRIQMQTRFCARRAFVYPWRNLPNTRRSGMSPRMYCRNVTTPDLKQNMICVQKKKISSRMYERFHCAVLRACTVLCFPGRGGFLWSAYTCWRCDRECDAACGTTLCTSLDLFSLDYHPSGHHTSATSNPSMLLHALHTHNLVSNEMTMTAF